MPDSLGRLKELDREVQTLDRCILLLQWDQETYMPRAGVEDRARQLSLLSLLEHQKATSGEIGELLASLGAGKDTPGGGEQVPEEDRPFVRELYRSYRRNTCLPDKLVKRLAEATSRGQSLWAQARAESDFSRFRDQLALIIELNLEKADKIGYRHHPYDALMDYFEPWMTTPEVSVLFNRLETSLLPLLERIKAAGQVDDRFLHGHYPVEKQREFSRLMLEKMGWDFQRGRVDQSVHPFTMGIGGNDVRFTTRYSENNPAGSIFGTIHEAGHGFYELGIDRKYRGTILEDGASFGIHESQSLTWENMVGRSRAFWSYFLPRLRSLFPENLAGIELDTFYRGINKVEPSFIRVEADEVTYSLHIILRFRLELGLLEGKLTVDDLPEAWRELSGELLGIVPGKDADGVLQDIHWSMGYIGYFPSYALGNLYGAQFWAELTRQIPGIYDRIAGGDLGTALDWLRKNIHAHGRSRNARELVEEVTGEPLDAGYFADYLETKYAEIYA